MRIKEIAAMAGNCREMRLINTRDHNDDIVRQHLDLNGRAIYPLDGMQAITKETLLTIADVEEEAREKYTVDQVDLNEFMAIYTDDQRDGDVILKPGKLRLKSKYFELMSLTPDGGGETVFLPVALIKPIKDADITWVLRKVTEEISIIVALEGFVNIAAFAPADMWADLDFAGEMHSMWLAANRLAQKNELRKLEDGR